MPAAVALILAGFTLIYSALTGKTLAEILSGDPIPRLNAAGGRGGGGVTAAGSQPRGPGGEGAPDPEREFKGPHAGQLRDLTRVAETKYHLRVSQICRPAGATYGASDSLHKQCRAVDLVGSVADRVAFARYAKTLTWVDEVFCDQAGLYAQKPFQHADHVHVGA